MSGFVVVFVVDFFQSAALLRGSTLRAARGDALEPHCVHASGAEAAGVGGDHVLECVLQRCRTSTLCIALADVTGT